MRDRELGPPYTSGTPHGRARRITANTRRCDHPTRIYRDVARYRFRRPQQAHLVCTAIRESFFLGKSKGGGLMVSSERPGTVCDRRDDGAEAVWRRAGGGCEGRVCGVGHACSAGGGVEDAR
jgi:hypothetical protein